MGTLAVTASHTAVAPRLRAGTELLGAYEDSGFTTPKFLVRRHDGQVIRVSQLLYLVTAQMDGRNDLATIAARASEQLDRTVTAEHVAHLVETKLGQLGIIEGSAVMTSTAADPLLGLRLRTGLVPERFHRGVTNALRPLFRPVVIGCVLLALLALDGWIAIRHRSTLLDGWIEILTRPGMFLALTAATIAAMAFHEFGHAAACRYSGGKPGAMGVGVYIVWPAFFTDVSDAYRLDRRGRLRTDLGGIYFNAIYALGALLAFAATGFAPLLVVAALTQAQALYQLAPFLRLDGYYILGDMIGVPNPFSYVWATVVAIFAPRRSPARRAARGSLHAVRRGARVTLVVWVVTAIPLLLAALALSVYLLPRSVPAVASTLQGSARTVGVSAREGEWIGATNAAMQFTFMSLPLLGWLSTLWWVAKPAARKIRRLDARWVRSAGAISVAVLALGALAVTLQLRSPERSANTASTPVVLPIDQLIPPPALEARHESTQQPAIESGATGGAVATTSAIAGAVERRPPTRWSLTVPVEAIATAAPAANGAPTVIGTWTVERGDDFWQIAGHVLTDLHGRAPSVREHHSYWTQLIDANRDGLVHPDDPGTIFRGQQIEVIQPAVAAGAVDGSSAEVPMN